MTKTTDQLEATWPGEFGNAYTERNLIDWHIRTPAFSHMLKGLSLRRALEVGCNRGHNLQCASEVLGSEAEVVISGVEPNRYALGMARTSAERTFPIPGNAFDLVPVQGSILRSCLHRWCADSYITDSNSRLL